MPRKVWVDSFVVDEDVIRDVFNRLSAFESTLPLGWNNERRNITFFLAKLRGARYLEGGEDAGKVNL